MSYTERPSDEFIALLKKTGDSDQNVAYAAQREFAKALELPLRKGVLVGNILGDIFETINVFSLTILWRKTNKTIYQQKSCYAYKYIDIKKCNQELLR